MYHSTKNKYKSYSRCFPNISFIAKILRAVAVNQFSDELHREGLFKDFRDLVSITAEMSTGKDDLLDDSDNGLVSTLALLDLSNVFDTINRKISL